MPTKSPTESPNPKPSMAAARHMMPMNNEERISQASSTFFSDRVVLNAMNRMMINPIGKKNKLA